MKPSLIEPLESRYAPAALVGIGNPAAQAENASGGTITFTVTLSEAPGQEVTIHYHTEDISGGATAGEDYQAISDAVLTFGANETTKTFTVAVNPDTKFENDETFRVVLSDPSNGLDLDPDHSAGVATITNDDSAPTLTVENVTKSESDGTMTFTLTLSAASGLPITMENSRSPSTSLSMMIC